MHAQQSLFRGKVHHVRIFETTEISSYERNLVRRGKPFRTEHGRCRMSPKAMDFFDHPRYNINKFLLSCQGHWPYQKKSQKIIILSLTFMYSSTSVPAQFAEVYIHRDNLSLMVPAIGPLIVHVAIIFKSINSIVFCDKLRWLLERIRAQWETPMGPEKQVLEQFADDGRYFTIVYSLWLLISIIMYLTVSTIPRILLKNGWANFSSSIVFAVPVYFSDHDEDYYIPLQIYVCVGISFMISVSVSMDVMFVVFVQHACGLFSMVGYRLEHLIEDEDLNIELCPDRAHDRPYWIVVDCIKKHQEALHFLDILESTNSWLFLIIVGINMLSISFSGLQMMRGASPDSIDEAIRQVLFVVALILHLFFESYYSERLSIYTLEVYNSLTRTKWYMTSFRTRQLIRYMMMKTIVPWEFKAGKMYTMSMANFSAVLRTSMSYLTILGSVE